MGRSAILVARIARSGLSARDEPSRVEALAARAMRRMAVPSELRDRRNPVPLIPAVLAEGPQPAPPHDGGAGGDEVAQPEDA